MHGTEDNNCFPEQARQLHQIWDNSLLWMIEGAHHSLFEQAIAATLAEATDTFANNYPKFPDYDH